MNAPLHPKGFSMRISTIADGNMSFDWGTKESVLENRKKFLESSGLRLENSVVMKLEHKNRVVCVDQTHAFQKNGEVITEALITKDRGVVLFLMTADCLPAVLYDPMQKVLALAHLGWKPTNEKLLKKVIQILEKDFHSQPKDILVTIGPGIQKESYKLVSRREEMTPEWDLFLQELPSGEIAVDLVGYNLAQLKELGVLPTNISTSLIDTAVNKEYFSHYRAVRTEEPEGRFATIAWLPEEDALESF